MKPSPAPSTRREARRQSRREAILDVAERSFMEHGYAGTTMSAIAARLGGSKATLWRYFASKELLFAAVLDRATDDFRQGLSLILSPDAPVDAALTGFCRQFLGKVNSPDALALHRLVMGEAGRFPEVGRIFFERAPGRTRRLLADYLALMMDQGRLRRADPLAAAIELIGLCLAGSHMQLLLAMIRQPGGRALDAEARAAVGTFLHAYAGVD